MIKEEKKEISYIDEIYLKINNTVRLAPKFNQHDYESILFRDGLYKTLKHGDQFEIYFVIPNGIIVDNLNIYSYGYYLKEALKN